MEKDHTWQLLIETRPPVTGGSSSLLKRLLITNEPCLCFGCDVPLCSPAPPSSCSAPRLAAAPGGLRGRWELRGGLQRGCKDTGWAQGWLGNGSHNLFSPLFPFSMKDNSFGALCGVKPDEAKLWDRPLPSWGCSAGRGHPCHQLCPRISLPHPLSPRSCAQAAEDTVTQGRGDTDALWGLREPLLGALTPGRVSFTSHLGLGPLLGQNEPREALQRGKEGWERSWSRSGGASGRSNAE